MLSRAKAPQLIERDSTRKIEPWSLAHCFGIYFAPPCQTGSAVLITLDTSLRGLSAQFTASLLPANPISLRSGIALL